MKRGWPKVTIRINDDRLKLAAGRYPVAELKARTRPPVPDDHALWVDGVGGSDRQLDDASDVDVVDAMVLYSVGPDGAHPHHVNIEIDGKWAVSENISVTGSQLRRLAAPPLTAEWDLYRVVGGAPDEKIADDEEVTLTEKAEFYSVPALITPGAK